MLDVATAAQAAASFASSPAGYISGLGLPAALLVMGFFGRRAIARQDARFASLEQFDREMSAAMTTNTQALAIIVERIAPMQTAIASNSGSVVMLGESVAVLRSKMADHEKWAQTEHERLMARTHP